MKKDKKLRLETIKLKGVKNLVPSEKGKLKGGLYPWVDNP